EGDVSEIKRTIAPGKERWLVKTGADPDAHLVGGQAPVQTTIEQRTNLGRPNEFPVSVRSFPEAYQNKRIRPVEVTIYGVEASIVKYKLESDGDYHLVLQGRERRHAGCGGAEPGPIVRSAIE